MARYVSMLVLLVLTTLVSGCATKTYDSGAEDPSAWCVWNDAHWSVHHDRSFMYKAPCGQKVSKKALVRTKGDSMIDVKSNQVGRSCMVSLLGIPIVPPLGFDSKARARRNLFEAYSEDYSDEQIYLKNAETATRTHILLLPIFFRTEVVVKGDLVEYAEKLEP